MDPAIFNFKFDGNFNSYHSKPQSELVFLNLFGHKDVEMCRVSLVTSSPT